MSDASTRRIAANGLTFAVAEAGRGDAVALLLHGFPENRSSWREQLPALASSGWRAVAPDLRGYGDSDRPEPRTAYRLAALIDDVSALFEALGARRRLLIGHDWGGVIAWAFAASGRPLDGLVVMNAPHPRVFQAVLRRSWRQRMRSWYAAFFQVPLLPELLLTANHAKAVGDAFRNMAVDPAAFTEEELAAYRAAALRPGAMTAMLNYYRANASEILRADRWTTRILTPTLLIWGEEDKALGLELTNGYADLVANLQVERLPGVSHWVQQEAPGLVNAALQRWLAAHLP